MFARSLRCTPLLLLLAGCTGPLLDQPSKLREAVFVAPPIFSWYESPDGTSRDWNALFWLVGQDIESGRTQSRALPIWWHTQDEPYVETTLLFPLWFERKSSDTTTRFYSLLYGSVDGPDSRTDYVVPPIFWYQRAYDGSSSDTFLLFCYGNERHGEVSHVKIGSIFGLASLLQLETGFPPEGENVPALGRTSSRRVTGPDVLGIVTAFGYDDVGDRRDIRFLTLLSSEKLSLFRSWRGRGDDPFVREWLFPLYMNLQDADDGWYYVGPLWGGWNEGERATDWWLLGALARTAAPEGDTWRVFGIPIISP